MSFGLDVLGRFRQVERAVRCNRGLDSGMHTPHGRATVKVAMEFKQARESEAVLGLCVTGCVTQPNHRSCLTR